MAGFVRRRAKRSVGASESSASNLPTGIPLESAGRGRRHSPSRKPSLITDSDDIDTAIAGFSDWLVHPRILFGLLRRPITERLQLLQASIRDRRVDRFISVGLMHRLADRRMLFDLARRPRASAELTLRRTISESLRHAAAEGMTSPSPVQLDPLRAAACVDAARMDPCRENVILVVHQASRTGAPVLGWNIAAQLASRYNLFTVVLAGGPLVAAFRALSVELYGPFVQGRQFTADVDRALLAMLDGRTFKYAIMNSCESRAAIGMIARHRIPTLLLMHEFGSCVYPPSELRSAFDLADEIVFPAEEVAVSSRVVHPGLNRRVVHILPQGLSALPPAPPGANLAVAPLVRDLARARSRGAFIVLGAGTVELRKGVDVFLSTAMAVAREPQGERVRFLWVGQGYKPKEDMQYSVYLQEQIARAGLEDRVTFLDETPRLEPIYELADTFLLSSRLDPMPNVAIDAAWRGIPVVCFKGASGIADLLLRDSLTATGVVDYLDPASAAGAILSLVRNPEHRADISAATERLARSNFDMEAYVEALDALGGGVARTAGVRRRRTSAP